MSEDPKNINPQIEHAAASDESIQRVHSALLREKPEPKEGYTPMPLFLLGFVSAMIFVVSIYFIHYRSGFDPMVYDERFDPETMGSGANQVAEVDPMVAGKRAFTQVCATCHQPTGMGVPGAFPPLVGSEWVVGDEATVIRILLNGLQGPIEVEGNTFNGVMPAFGPGGGYNWKDDRIAHVLTYIRAEWGNTGEPVTPERVKEIRESLSSTAPWTVDKLKAAASQ